jgi:GNAT superfamily N-acetyltransferase
VNISYQIDDRITPDEMMSLAEAVGWGRHRTLARNRIAIAGSRFIATARADRKLIGLLRLVGDGAYILHVADMMVHPSFQLRGVGRRLAELALDYARQIATGRGNNMGEFTLFAAPGAAGFWKKQQFVPSNGMVLADTPEHRAAEQSAAKESFSG